MEEDEDVLKLERELARLKANVIPPRQDIVWRIVRSMPFRIFVLVWMYWRGLGLPKSLAYGVTAAVFAIVFLAFYRHLKYDPADRLKIGYDDLYDFSPRKPRYEDTDDLSAGSR
jgi:hypothetical protein